ncbi:MAG: hypothetical protein K9M75_03570 [Phycisphaerae bacterium]|nr:hypothetical protein [Phycisphaerae bacterium]
MIKHLKLASYLSVALAVSTVIFAGIGLTRVNETVSERAEFLDKPNVIEQLREIEIPKGNEDKTPPLVVQAIAFALRIDPPPPPPPPKPKPPIQPTGSGPNIPREPSVIDKARPELPTAFKLLATCVYENHPEKSLAMIDETSKGSKWVRQGDTIGYKVIHQINDGNVVIYQGGKQSAILEVPKKNAVSSLIKGSGTTVTAAAASYSDQTSTNRTIKDTSSTTRDPAHRRPPRSLPARQTPEEARKATARNTGELKAILDNISTKSKDDSDNKDGKEDLMKAVMLMLKNSSEKAEAKKAEAIKAEANKKSSK